MYFNIQKACNTRSTHIQFRHKTRHQDEPCWHNTHIWNTNPCTSVNVRRNLRWLRAHNPFLHPFFDLRISLESSYTYTFTPFLSNLPHDADHFLLPASLHPHPSDASLPLSSLSSCATADTEQRRNKTEWGHTSFSTSLLRILKGSLTVPLWFQCGILLMLTSHFYCKGNFPAPRTIWQVSGEEK